MNRSKGRKGRSAPLPLFVSKLLQMVQDPQIQPVIGWTSGGDSFNIKSVSRFTEQVLPRYFKHKNFSSFIRQLNMYGFRKVRHSEGENVYMNEHFRIGGRHQLRNINRRIREEREERVVLYHEGGRQGGAGRELQDLRNKQKNLEQMCKHFLIQNQRLMEENQTLVKRMESESREKERRMEEFLLMLLAQKHNRQVTNGGGQPFLSIWYGEGRGIDGKKTRDLSPLEVVTANLERDQHFTKVHTMIENIYGRKNQGRKDGNYTIVPQEGVKQSEEMLEIKSEAGGGLSLEKEDEGFLSINSFMDADDFQRDINLEESR